MVSAVLARLSRGYEPQPLFDRRTRPIYFMLGATLAAAIFALAFFRYSISPAYLLAGWTFPILLLGAFLARRIGHPKIAGFLEANTLITGQAVVIYLLLIPLAAFGAPYADGPLSRADVALGFNWRAYADAVALYMPVLLRAYRSFQVQPTLVLLLLFWTGRDDRAWQFVTASIFALFVTAFLFPFVPAKGAFAYYGITDYSALSAKGEWMSFEVLDHIRSGARYIDNRALGGIVSFPSFHTVMAVLLTWAAWPTWARYPILLLNVLMVAAAVVCGSHYLIDIIGGALLALLSIFVVTRNYVVTPA